MSPSPKTSSRETVDLVQTLDTDQVEDTATGIAAVRERDGRLFILGVGGSAGLGQPRRQRLPQDLRASSPTPPSTTSPS